MAKIKPLRNSPIFKELTDRELALFARIISEEEYGTGTVLYAENMKSTQFYFIEKGQVEITSEGLEGEGTILLQEGDTFGEWSLIAPTHLTTVSAKVKANANILVLEGDDFKRFSEEEPAIAFKVIRGVMGRIWETVDEITGTMRAGKD